MSDNQAVDNAESNTHTERKRLGRGGIIAIIVVALLVVGGGTAFGVHAYRDAQATAAAEALVESVMTQQEQADVDFAAYADRVGEARQALDHLVPVNEMTQARQDLFDGSTITALNDTVTTLDGVLADTGDPAPTIADRFNGQDWGEALVDEYRAADAQQREAIEAQVQQALQTLRDAQADAQTTSDEIVDSAMQARDATLALAEQLPAQAETLIEQHNEATTDAQEALREASNAEAIGDITDALIDHIIVYIETADQLQASHTQAVEEREAAEAAAAAAAAAASSGGGGGGGGGASLCYRWTWLGTVLEPC